MLLSWAKRVTEKLPLILRAAYKRRHSDRISYLILCARDQVSIVRQRTTQLQSFITVEKENKHWNHSVCEKKVYVYHHHLRSRFENCFLRGSPQDFSSNVDDGKWSSHATGNVSLFYVVYYYLKEMCALETTRMCVYFFHLIWSRLFFSLSRKAHSFSICYTADESWNVILLETKEKRNLYLFW